tara:strand:+ start:1195 stop:1467 length:273 start_codon:yes stop_codon:yes gene_type:complete
MKNEKSQVVDEVSTATAILNYLMNTFMPYVCVLGILIYNSGFEMWSSYLILPLMYFSSKYSFNCGIAHVLCEATEDVNGRLMLPAELKDK